MTLFINQHAIRGDFIFYYCNTNRFWFDITFGIPIYDKKLKRLHKRVKKEVDNYCGIDLGQETRKSIMV